MSNVELREMNPFTELDEINRLMQQLRPELDSKTFEDRAMDMHDLGYRILGLYSAEDVVAVAGVTITMNLDYGKHLYVQELVTDSDYRSQGFGRQFMALIEDWAATRDCTKVVLTSSFHREQAQEFYEHRVCMTPTGYVFKKEVERT